MIVLDLTCSEQHRFEAWFRSAADFGEQQNRGLVACPQCGCSSIRRLPSAAHLALAASPTVNPVRPQPPEAGHAAAAAPHPLTVLKAVVEHVVRNSEDVGGQFAEEARKIHYHESPARAIRGQATADDCEALWEEGIAILRVPVIKPEDLN